MPFTFVWMKQRLLNPNEVRPGMISDFNKDNRVVVVEILDLRSRVGKDKLNLVQLETV